MNRLTGIRAPLKPWSLRGIAVTPPSNHPATDIGKERDPRTFIWLKEHNYQDNLRALDSVKFRRPAKVDYQCLDVGCGPGNFVTEALLPRLGQCRRVIATDKAASMVEYARKNYPNPAVVYDVLDIERGDIRHIVDKYQLFDRVYSFMTFHYVNDLERAYRNVCMALKDGGEFMAVSFTGAAITDVWYQLSCTEEWKALLPDPKKLLSQRFCYSAPIPQSEIAYIEEKAASAAGLELLSCRMYDSYWTMPDVDSWLAIITGLSNKTPWAVNFGMTPNVGHFRSTTRHHVREGKLLVCADLTVGSAEVSKDCYIPFFRLDSGVPEDKRAAFREACRSLLLKASIAKPNGCDLRHSVIVVHSQKPGLGHF